MNARYETQCSECGQTIGVGDEITKQAGIWVHAQCPEETGANKPNQELESISQGEGYGGRPFAEGKTIWHPHKKGVPVTVVSCGKRYYREDGLSFGVGADRGYVYHAKVRPATEEEAQPLREAYAQRKQQQAAKDRLKEIKTHLREDGECPDSWHDPEGERILDTQNIHGGGDWFIIGSEYLWYVSNNGSDGDMWAANNVRTQGAGAIGWRLPREQDAEVVEELRQLNDLINQD